MNIPNPETMTPLHRVTCEVAARLAVQGPIDYLEIGVREGGGLLDLLPQGTTRLAVAVDTWGGQYGGTNRGSPDYVAEQLGPLIANTILLTGNSPDVMRGMRHKFDLIMIDGDHSEAGCKADLDACLPLLKSTGAILIDDLEHISHKYLHPLCERWAAAHSMKFVFHNEGLGIGEITY